MDDSVTPDAPEGRPLVEDEEVGAPRPREVLHLEFEQQKHRWTTQRWIALSVIAILGITVATACAGWLWTNSSLEEFGIVLSAVFGLTGPVLGFYFSSER